MKDEPNVLELRFWSCVKAAKSLTNGKSQGFPCYQKKRTSNDPSKYRPISVISCLGNILERLKIA
ncbi:hypothetical protein BpHYR1_022288 [Brachionus plicatilis]|uniref:RNA-directed DNA polymerase from mobile element jockey-like n=1 Tax=Brachionus plicatilis TaxID=10195 RepID=A0A3M7QK10_BRAPC|nr:hypothetical protein BpHYR1_022288 [Brachionus plicatilis]